MFESLSPYVANGRMIKIVFIVSIVFTNIASFAFAQNNDPRSDPFPMLDFADPQKSIVVELQFDDRFNANAETINVVRERTRVRAGDPPLLKVEVIDLDGEIVETFNAWHPQWVFVEDGVGGERRIIEPGAVGRIVAPFAPEAAEFRITDVPANMLVASVDLLPDIHDFCRQNRSDPDCFNIANRKPVCNAGGPYSAQCSASIQLNGSASSDPDMDDLTHRWSGTFAGNTVVGAMPTVIFENVGTTVVQLDLEDEFGGATSCEAPVAVIDSILPAISCNNPPTFERPRAPVTFQASAQDSCDGEITPVITEFECFKTNPNGKRIDVTNHCRVDLLGDRVRINGIGLPDVTITWKVSATDQSGNTSGAVCAATAEPASGPPPEKTRPGKKVH